MSETVTHPDPPRPAALPPSGPRHSRRRPWLAAAALACAFLVGAGAASLLMRRPQVTLANLSPTAINTLTADTSVALKGKVADVFGKSFVVDDGTGRALVDAGPTGENGTLVKTDETVTVQGRFDRGVVRAAAITHADGRSDVLASPGPPSRWGGPHGPLAWLGPRP